MPRVGDREREGPLGTCPNCDCRIPRENLILAYEADGDWPRLFAECPACEDAVHPR